ncbi:MAG: aminopeptidase [Eubacteriales bacterium]|nr:aminopeptidase [Eubacteriales bacterium]
MKDKRVEELARILINYSVALKPGEKILIENFGRDLLFAGQVIREAYKAGGIPFLTLRDNSLQRIMLTECSIGQIKDAARFDTSVMSEMQAYIGIRSNDNISELSAVPHDKMKIYSEYYVKPVHTELRVKKTKWCVLRYPNDSMAQLAGMATEDFEDYYFRVCNLDYSKMSAAMEELAAYIVKTNMVRVKGPGTDLSFSVKGMPAIKCDGNRNIPDGELFTAPVKTSVNGVISYNAPAVYQGVTFNNIRFEFKDGRIIKAEAGSLTDRINKILDTDEGARYVGEFSFGLNPYIEKPMLDTLFDEKISGSIHLTPGSCYEECDNGNQSAIHWDLVLIQRPEAGGGEIWFDDELIRKDGMFVPEGLHCLNPENLR